MQRIVFNAHYLTYLDTAMGAYWRELAMPYAESMARMNGDLFVKKATLEYHAAAEYDDALQIGLRLQAIGNSSLRYAACVFRDVHALVSGELIYVFADPVTRQPRTVPEALRTALSGFETGAPVVEVSVGDWQAWSSKIFPLRDAVFVAEQGIAPQLVWDDADASACHAAACNRLGQVVASGRLLAVNAETARIGRMATHKNLRGQGLARGVLQKLVQEARLRGFRRLMLHAQHSAIGLYLKEGFVPVGDTFEEAGILHQEMEKWLPADAQ
jgi:YbgC/YbaW family acyl-CoA thioester hydrolase